MLLDLFTDQPCPKEEIIRAKRIFLKIFFKNYDLGNLDYTSFDLRTWVIEDVPGPIWPEKVVVRLQVPDVIIHLPLVGLSKKELDEC